jgi:hypothetical protein
VSFFQRLQQILQKPKTADGGILAQGGLLARVSAATILL